MLHICDVCYKTFNTNQHLTQHKNRKYKCKPYSISSTPIEFTYPTSPKKYLLKGDSNSSVSHGSSMSSRLSSPRHSEISNSNINEPKTPENVNITYNEHDEAELNETNSVNSSAHNAESKSYHTNLDNISVTNLLEFMNTHKQMLEEKNRLETTLMILKNKMDVLTRENFEMKNKLYIVNGFITNYKTSNADVKQTDTNADVDNNKGIFSNRIRRKTPSSN